MTTPSNPLLKSTWYEYEAKMPDDEIELQTLQQEETRRQLTIAVDARLAFECAQKAEQNTDEILKALQTSTASSAPPSVTLDSQLIHLPSANPNFVGREVLLQDLARRLIPENYDPRSEALIAILQALGGMGKTEAACRFANNNVGKFGLIWFFQAESKHLLNEDYRKLADSLKLPTKNKSPEEIRREVHDYIETTPSARPRLLIYDGAEEMPEKLPSRGAGILVTTRRPNIYPKADACIEVTALTLKETAELAQKFGCDFSQEGLKPLHQELDGWAFLTYLSLHSLQKTKETVESYLRRVKTGDPFQESSSNYPRSLRQIVQTMMATFEKNSLAVEFFKIAVHMNPDRVSLGLFHFWLGEKKVQDFQGTQASVIQALTESGLVKFDGNHFTYHRLVQVSAAQFPGAEKDYQTLVALLKRRSAAFVAENSETWEGGKDIAEQIDSLRSSRFWPQVSGFVRQELLHCAGLWLMNVECDLGGALKCHEAGLEIAEDLKDGKRCALAKFYIYPCLNNLRRHEEAFAALDSALQLLLAHAPNNFAMLAKVYADHATLRALKEKKEEALSNAQQALALCLKMNENQERPDLLVQIYNSLQKVFRVLGEFDQAIAAGETAIQLLCKFKNKESSLLAASVYEDNALALSEKGQFDDALKDLQRVKILLTHIYKKEEHPAVKKVDERIKDLERAKGKQEAFSVDLERLLQDTDSEEERPEN